MTGFWRNRKSLMTVAAVVVCSGAFAVSVAFTYPQPVSTHTLGAEWQCHRAVGIFVTCTRVGRVEPMLDRQRREPVDLRRV